MIFKGKRALVLASSAGLGRATAEKLSSLGAYVCLNGRHSESLEAIVQAGGAHCFVAGDLLKVGEANRVVLECIKKLGGLDILVTNTGGPAKNNFLDVTDQQWAEDFQGIWMSAVESIRAALPGMLEQKYGRIVMITSIAAQKALPGLTTSNGLRAGLDGLIRSLALEHSKNGLTFNCVKPGYINTDRLKSLNIPKDKESLLAPMGHFGEPEDIANMVCFLASDQAKYVTGQSIAVDGGVTLS